MGKTLQDLVCELGESRVDALAAEYIMLKIAKASKFDELVELLRDTHTTIEQLREMV